MLLFSVETPGCFVINYRGQRISSFHQVFERVTCYLLSENSACKNIEAQISEKKERIKNMHLRLNQD